ncbi:MAG: DUF3048 domain-containing protein [Anaerolineae bacterium]
MLILFSHRRIAGLAILLAVALLAGACRSLPRETAAALADRLTAAAPTATAAAAPPTAVPTPTPEPTAIPAPTVNMAALVGDETLPAGVSPFTGLPVDDPTLLERMPAAVKISNSPIARPQSGLSKADVVIEHLAEGDITRFTAIFHSQDAQRIGSVRSALADRSGAPGAVRRLFGLLRRQRRGRSPDGELRFGRSHPVRRAQGSWLLPSGHPRPRL